MFSCSWLICRKLTFVYLFVTFAHDELLNDFIYLQIPSDFMIHYHKILGDAKYKGAKVEYVLKCEQGPWVQSLTREIKIPE